MAEDLREREGRDGVEDEDAEEGKRKCMVGRERRKQQEQRERENTKKASGNKLGKTDVEIRWRGPGGSATGEGAQVIYATCGGGVRLRLG